MHESCGFDLALVHEDPQYLGSVLVNTAMDSLRTASSGQRTCECHLPFVGMHRYTTAFWHVCVT